MRNTFVLICVFAVIAVVHTNAKLIRPRRSEETCGVPKRNSGLIVRGQSFSRGDFPWIVALMSTETRPPSFFCGGTIISSSFVLSAAHCINPKESPSTRLPRDVIAFFGAHDLSDYFETGRFALSPKDIIVHDKWNPRTTQYDADLSLLEFEAGSIHFNDFVQPICLWDLENEPTATDGIVSGWGKSEDPVKKHEDVPKMVKVLIYTNEQCFLDKIALTALSSLQTFCAGLRNGSGICFGDSGGGLFIKESGAFYLKGIVSSSLIHAGDCDVSNNAIYTNVLKFKEWITEKTGKAAREVLCTFKLTYSHFYDKKLKTCDINEVIDREGYVVGSPRNNSVEAFIINDKSKVVFLPKGIGQKFPELKAFWAFFLGLTVVRDYYFKDMGNLRHVYFGYNKISTIEAGALKELVNVVELDFTNNIIETLDGKLFATMVNLERLFLVDNKIKFLTLRTFEIPEGKLQMILLTGNVCTNENYYPSWDRLEGDIRANCTQ